MIAIVARCYVQRMRFALCCLLGWDLDLDVVMMFARGLPRRAIGDAGAMDRGPPPQVLPSKFFGNVYMICMGFWGETCMRAAAAVVAGSRSFWLGWAGLGFVYTLPTASTFASRR